MYYYSTLGGENALAHYILLYVTNSAAGAGVYSILRGGVATSSLMSETSLMITMGDIGSEFRRPISYPQVE